VESIRCVNVLLWAATTVTAPTSGGGVPGDDALQRTAWILVAAVATLLLREIWQAVQSRRQGRQRDREVLTALAREVLAINAVAHAIVNDINRERALLNESAQWRMKPMLILPTSIYDIARDRMPSVLIKQSGSFVQLIGLQTQCIFMNQVVDAQQRWKAPAARGLEDQLEMIASFHASMEEAILSVIDRCDRLLPILTTAGESVGGLLLERAGTSAEPQPS
jgi:hypothetical protein